jgi:hypothetical protein
MFCEKRRKIQVAIHVLQTAISVVGTVLRELYMRVAVETGLPGKVGPLKVGRRLSLLDLTKPSSPERVGDFVLMIVVSNAKACPLHYYFIFALSPFSCDVPPCFLYRCYFSSCPQRLPTTGQQLSRFLETGGRIVSQPFVRSTKIRRTV